MFSELEETEIFITLENARPLISAWQVRFAAIDGTTISTSSTSASTTGLLTSGSSTIGDKSTVPSGSPADSPSSGSESTGGAVASEASGSQGSQGSQERRVDSQTAMLANVADVNLLIGKLSLEGTPSPAEFKHSPETALSLLEGCCRMAPGAMGGEMILLSISTTRRRMSCSDSIAELEVGIFWLGKFWLGTVGKKRGYLLMIWKKLTG
ncbi:hypothetical protein BSKO_09667 [Bryopsis sp. KO-2023]|nr:hypothetical protein BSKO_09667 [Bryopsis sp. KO-2023]